MKKVVFITSILLSSLIASSIEDITKKSLENSFDIKGLQKSIQIASEQINIAKNWENPMLSFKTNNIMLNKNYLNSQKEYGIEISQAIPIGYKLEIEKAIAQKDKLIQEYNLEDKKLELTSKIYSYSYLILIIENRLNLLNEYQNNLNHLEKLYSNLFTYNKANLNEILNTQISKDELQMQIDELETKKRNIYLNLEILSLEKIDKIDDKLDIKPINKADLEESIQSHPKIKTLYTTSQKYKDNSKLEEAKKFSSITLGLEYIQNSEQDYANIYLSIPLPIYNTENINKLKANLNANETNNRLDSQIHNLKIQNEIFLNNLELANRNYKLIEEQIIPKKQKIQ